MAKEYVSGKKKYSPPNRRRRRRNRAPILPIAIAGILVIVIAVIVIVNWGDGGDDSTQEGISSDTSSSISSSQVSDEVSEGISDKESEASADESSPTSEAPSTPPPKSVEDKETQTDLGPVIVVGDAAFEYYNFVESVANDYIRAVRAAADSLNGTSELYAMVIPTSMDILLPEDFLATINTSNQNKAINYFYSSFEANDNITTVPVFDALNLRNDEYIYFRTDHHWTALGAYYAYQQWAQSKGVDPMPIDSFTTRDITGFLGSFYSDTNKSAALGANPDTITQYLPDYDTYMKVYPLNGEPYEWPMIYDTSEYDVALRYNGFIASDNPYTEITNLSLNDGSACILIKESFGNAFAPYLTAHYQNVYVVDYRYWDGSIASLAAEKGVEDVIILNNISMTRSSTLVNDLSSVF